MSAPTRILIAAGEASGDRLAAEVIAELVRRRPAVEVRGMVGPRLRELGVGEVARAEDVTAVGLVEALAVLPAAWRSLRALSREMSSWRPDLVLTVDSPALLLRVARAARARGIPAVHAVSPQVWAWRPGRVRAVARAVDAVLCLFPLEPPLYAGLGVDAVLVGHPLLDRLAGARVIGDGATVALLPGSRPAEVRALWPAYREVAGILARTGLRFEILVAPTVDPRALDGVPGRFVHDVRELRADAALAASGTATLELAALGVPMVVAYRVHPLTWAVGRRLVRVRHLALPNLLAGRAIVPEHLQDLRPAEMARDVLDALARPARQREELARVVEALGGGGAIARAADAVERWLDGRREPP